MHKGVFLSFFANILQSKIFVSFSLLGRKKPLAGLNIKNRRLEGIPRLIWGLLAWFRLGLAFRSVPNVGKVGLCLNVTSPQIIKGCFLPIWQLLLDKK